MTAAIFGRSPGITRLALDHRGDDQQLVGRHVQGAGAGDLHGTEVFLEGDQLLFHEPADGRALEHVVGRREQEAFEVGRTGRGAVGGRVEQRRAPRGGAVAARAGRRRATSWAICARVLPSVISTLTTGGCASSARAWSRARAASATTMAITATSATPVHNRPRRERRRRARGRARLRRSRSRSTGVRWRRGGERSPLEDDTGVNPTARPASSPTGARPRGSPRWLVVWRRSRPAAGPCAW